MLIVIPLESRNHNNLEFIYGLRTITWNDNWITVPFLLGPNKHTITMIKDAVRDGLRAVKNAIEDSKWFHSNFCKGTSNGR